MENLHLLIPEIVLAVLGLLILLAELVVPRDKSELLYHAGIFAAGITLVIAGTLPQLAGGFGTGTLWTFDPMALFLKDLILISAALTLMLTMDYSRLNHGRAGAYTTLVLWCATGMMVLVSSVDLLLLFLALELVSLSTFVLTGFERRSMASSEGAIKYFLIGAFSSAVTVYGISLVYGATGSTNLLRTAVNMHDPILIMGLVFATVGFAFKASLAPFHMWVPDAYEGAPTPITTFMSVAPKIATLGALLRVFTVLLPHHSLQLTGLFFTLAALTMTIGNLAAIFQDNVKRLLAYSSIAQAGYIMIGFVVGDNLGREGVLLYSLVYLFMNFGAFAVAMIVAENTGSYDIKAFSGLAQRNLGLALIMAFFLLSLAGIPPLAGFIGKFYLFAAAIQGEWYWLATIGVLNSVVSVYYYLRIAYQMFFVEPVSREPLAPRFYLNSSLVLTGFATFAIGLYPDPIIATIKSSLRFLP